MLKKVFRVYFVSHNEAKTRTDLGVTLGKYKTEGIGWTRAFQLLSRDNNGSMPHGHIEFEQVQSLSKLKEVIK